MPLYSEDKIIQHDKCDQKQALNHFFVTCPDVQTFWQSFSRWRNVKNDDFIVFNDETIIYRFTRITSIVLQEIEKITTSKPSLHTLKANYL